MHSKGLSDRIWSIFFDSVFLVFIGAVVGTSPLFGQGQILFQNGNSTAITNWTSYPDSTATGKRSPINTMVGLYMNANAAATSVAPGWSLQATTNLAAPGLFFGGIRTTTFPAGTPVAVQVRAWLASTT
jgi:hypothetical protein